MIWAVQSIGSSELTRNSTSSFHSLKVRTRAVNDDPSRRAHPYDPRCTPVMTILLVPGRDSALEGGHDAGERSGATGTPRLRNDAIAALFLASRLHAQGQRRTAAGAGCQRSAAGIGAVAEPLSRRQVEAVGEGLAKPILVRVERDLHHVRKRAKILWLACRVAAGHDDLDTGIRADDTTNRLPRALIRAGCDRAAIHDHEVGLVR